jgi:SAM-dependent methyltransferase
MVTNFGTAYALFTLVDSPLYGDLQRDGFIRVAAAVETHKLVERHVVGLLRFLVTQDIFKEEKNETFHLTPKGRSATARAPAGWIRMIVGGYGGLMHNATAMLKGELTYNKDIRRDPFNVSVGSTMCTSSVQDEVPYRVIERAGAHVIADLGCGGGTFLIEWVKRNPKNRGVGIDVAPAAIEASNAAARAAGVADRAKFVVGNCFDLSQVAPECRDVEFFYSFALEHEILSSGEQAVLDHIDRMGELFAGKRYLIGEPLLNMVQFDGNFYWVHVLSHQGYPKNIPGWCELLRGLKHGALDRVYVPEHQKIGGFFDVRLGQR